VSGLIGRVLIAVPLLVIAILAVVVGGWPMVALAVAFGVVAMHEYGAATHSLRPLTIAGFAGVLGIIVVTHQGGLVWSLAPLMGTLLLAFWLSAVADVRQAATVQLSVTLLGVVWIGYGLAFLVALRDIPAPDDWGKQLLIAVLVGVWLSDTFAYFGGRMFGKRKLAAAISPNKTVEGLVIGFVLGAAAVFFTLYNQPSQDPISPLNALEFAVAIAAASPVGDLFESYLKRDMGVKDSGRLLGGHGGVLDRVDGLLFAGAAAFFVALALHRVA
jgi:phosphatidate cytidylyltransferase